MITIENDPLMASIRYAAQNEKDVLLTFPRAGAFADDGSPLTKTLPFRISFLNEVTKELKGAFLVPVDSDLDLELRPYSIVRVEIID